MATNTAQPNTSSATPRAQGEVWAGVKKVLKPLASLRLTVVLFALSIVLVLAGTLAQDTMSIEAVKANYFKVWVCSLNLQLLFPSGFFPQGSPLGDFDLWLFFPGGKTLGLLMLINLLAAHTVRFTWQGRGPRLWMGLGVIAAGMLVTAAVIASGMNTDSVYRPILSWEKIWYLLLSSLAAVTLVSIYGAFTVPPEKKLLSWLLIALAAALLAATVWLGMRTFTQGVEDARLEPSSMRILWQLLKGTFAGVVLLAGCILAFKKRAGIVLLHGGVALLMISELLVNLQAVEMRMTLFEGQSTNYAVSTKEYELAFVDRVAVDKEQVVVVPQAMLLNTGSRISAPELPFDIQVEEYYLNSALLGPAQAQNENVENLATAGSAAKEKVVAVERPESPGSTSGTLNQTSAYITFYEKGSEEPLGTYLLGYFQSPPAGDIPEIFTDSDDGQRYEVMLRPKRHYREYTVQLLDTGRRNYLGTNTPMDYYSQVRVLDPTREEPINERIWMNNPLRFAGQTYYMSDYGQTENGSEFATFQVVKNTSWMIPYVSCMIVGVGMLFQFCLTLSRFLNRQQGVLLASETPAVVPQEKTITGKDGKKVHLAQPAGKTPAPRRFDPLTLAVAAALVVMCSYWVMKKSQPEPATAKAYDYYTAGQIPLAYEGRTQPLDSLARNQLRIIQGKQTFQACMSPEELAKNWDEVKADLLSAFPTIDPKPLDAIIRGQIARPEVDPHTLDPSVPRPKYRATVDDITLNIAQQTGEDTLLVQRKVENIASTSQQPAIRWLFDVMARPELALKHRVFRVENIEIVEQLGLEHRSGLRYSYEELLGHVPGTPLATAEAPTEDDATEDTSEEERMTIDDLFDSVERIDPSELTFYQRKVRELDRRMSRFVTLVGATQLRPPAGTSSDQTDWLQGLEKNQPPLLAPPAPEEQGMPQTDWALLPSAAALEQYVKDQTQGEQEFNPGVADLLTIYETYAAADPRNFNRAVRQYLSYMNEDLLSEKEGTNIGREAYFNHFEPFYVASVLYFLAFLVITICWLLSGLSVYEKSAQTNDQPQRPSLFKRILNPESLRYAGLALICLALVVHTWALWQRMAISGRPPVTNLYSSAVFIGWAAVVLGIVLEVFFRRGLGVAIAAWAGFGTLLIANFLSATSGDTFAVMQAILDTQFWLATHVVCVTLGYATTFLAGLLGIVYIVGGLLIPRFATSIGKDLARMVYGILCFAIFFSFVGTVLGGLWADDSWGRFWGWDPKENGALIIVLWNALVLHARWAGMVRDRGLAVLAVAGNITTSWSWFGVNELGIGLHSYGFTEGMLAILGTWCLVQLAIIVLGSLPKKYWLGFKSEPNAAGT